ncbi:MAG: hypothetical protein R2697_07560 [Ilumatobacteraceae bacterium]
MLVDTGEYLVTGEPEFDLAAGTLLDLVPRHRRRDGRLRTCPE